MSERLGKSLVVLLFDVLLPVALVAWARGVREAIDLPVPDPLWGLGLLVFGAVLSLAGVVTLTRRGGGLPTNLYPPPHLVDTGVFKLVRNPIYTGFAGLCFGTAIWTGSSSGVWLVAPVATAAAAALWWGYERPELAERLGLHDVWLSWPPVTESRSSLKMRVAALLGVSLPALVLFVTIAAAGLSPSVAEGSWLVIAAAASLAMWPRRQDRLRRAMLRAWVGMAVLGCAYLALPGGPLGGRLDVSITASLAGILVAALAPRATGIVLGPAIVLTLTSSRATFVELGDWSNVEVTAALVAFVWALPVPYWRAVQTVAGWNANMWREKMIGPVRVFNIGTLAAIPCGGGLAYAGWLAGPEHAWTLLWTGLAAIVGSALWAQAIEGSPALSRPYGFFGGMFTVISFGFVAPLFGTPTWTLFGVLSVAGPWIQGIGRLRCIANGCCHGAPCPASQGIVYENAHTRVLRLANLGGRPIYPTQLWSLFWLSITGCILMRLWAEGARLSLIGGVYLMGMALGRFVEECYRGEPQTPVHAGLRLYQWVSIGCLLAGAAVTALPSPRATAAVWSIDALEVGLIFAATTWIASSIDFPGSARRFARLA